MVDMNTKELDLSQAHINLISYVLNKGCEISIIDPDREDYDEDYVARFGLEDIDKVISEIEAWDGGQDFYVACPGTGKLYWVGLAIGYGNEPHETVYDYIPCPILDEWLNQFIKEHG